MRKTLAFLLAASLLCGAPGSVLALGESGKPMTDYAPLHELAQAHGFKLGAAYSHYQMRDQVFLNTISRHFSSVTATNETKAYSMLDQVASQAAEDGMPRMNYFKADRMLRWAQENGIAVRGHVLVWDAFMTEWFFHEGYSTAKPIADKDTMRARVKSYIEQVMTHFHTEFPGLIYCWDVVNEAIGDSASEYMPGDPRHIRTVRDGKPNPFREYVGEDYVEYAFLCARDTAEKLNIDVKLYYNDYNMFYDAKREAACALIDSINSYAKDENGEYRALVDGLGMQGYIGGYGKQAGCLNDGDIRRIRTSIETYAAKGLEVQLTEMAVRNYVADEPLVKAHAKFYGKLFEMLCEVNAGEEKPLTAVSIWGLIDAPELDADNYSYRMNGPFCGLFTETMAVKTSFEAVYTALGGKLP